MQWRNFSGFTSATAVGLLFVMAFGASSVDARRRRRAAPAPLSIAVLPFEGMGVAGGVMRESVEIELELLDFIRLQSSASVARGIVRNGKRAFEPRKLKSTMRKSKIDALVKGVQEGDTETLHVVVYGADGKPRYSKRFKRGDDIDELASNIVIALSPTLKKFRSARAIRVAPAKEKSAQEDRDRDPLDDTDLFVDVDDDKPKKKKKKKSRDKKRRRLDDDDDDGGRRSIVGGNDDDEAPDEAEEKRPRRSFTKSSASDRGLSGSSSRPKKKLRKLGDDGDDTQETGGFFQPGPLTPLLHVSANIGGGFWYYNFNSVPEAAGQSYGFTSSVFPAGSLRAVVWPIQYVGVEAEVSTGLMFFRFEPAANQADAIRPGEFQLPRLSASIAARARYILELGDSLGIGIGARLGYRFQYVGTEPQTMGEGVDATTVTIIPGFSFHALGVGPEIFIPFKVGSNRFEIEVSTDIIPGVSFYGEDPDNPGATSLALGGNARIGLRAEILFGAFVEVSAYTNVIYSIYTGAGGRVYPVKNADGTRDRLQGGEVTNATAGAQLGLGWMF